MADLIYGKDTGIEDGDGVCTIGCGSLGTCETLATCLFKPNSQRPLYSELDINLAVLVARCVSNKKETQPSLSELLARASTAVNRRHAAFYNDREEETDQKIRKLVQELILDPDADNSELFKDIDITMDREVGIDDNN